MAETTTVTPTKDDDVWSNPPQQTPAPAQQPPPAATQQPQTSSGDVWTDDSAKSGSIAEATKSWWDWADKSILDDVSGGFASKQLAHENEISQKIIQHEMNSAHPWRAAMAQFYYGSLKDAADFGMQFTNPKNLALQVAGAAKLRAAKAALVAANTYFFARGSQELLTERQESETQADYVQRILYSASTMTASAAGAAKEGGELVSLQRKSIQTKLGISGNLADKVDQKVRDIQALRDRGTQAASGEVLRGVQEAGDIFDQAAAEQRQARGTLDDVVEQAPIRMGQIVKDASHAVHLENARVSKLFDDMAAKTEEPVSDAPTIRAKIIDTMKEHGIQDHEIPPKVFNALFKRGATPQLMEDTGAGPVAIEISRIMGPADELPKPVSFSDLTRVRNDLYETAQSASDPVVKNGLFDAYDSITQMQEDYAGEKGFSDEYANAKNQYKLFKRELGSGLMADFLKAEDYKQQAMTPKLAKIMGGQDLEALRGLLKMAGVEVAPIDQLIAQKKGAVQTLRETPKAAAKAAGKAVSASQQAGKRIEGETEREARALGKANSVIPKVSDLELQGKTTEEIRREALNRISTNARANGISNPMGMFMLVYGIIRLGLGSPFGAYPAARGGASVLKNQQIKLLKNPSFQDWVIREGGADPTNGKLIGKLRNGLTALARAVGKMATPPEPPEEDDRGRL